MKPAPPPTIPRLPTHTTARLTRLSRGQRLTVHRIRKQTGCDVVWSFHEPDEHADATGVVARDTAVRDRATTPSAELIEACERLDPYTGNPRE